jgi:hypothetical protein
VIGLSLFVSQCLAKPLPPAAVEPAPSTAASAQQAIESPQEILNRFNAFLDRA